MITCMKKNTLKCVGCFDTSDTLPVIIPLSDAAFTECFLPDMRTLLGGAGITMEWWEESQQKPSGELLQ